MRAIRRTLEPGLLDGGLRFLQRTVGVFWITQATRNLHRVHHIERLAPLLPDKSFILVANHRREFYHCLTEKMLTYALGRGLEYYDVGTVDAIVARIEKGDGRFSGLLMGIIESAPFQRTRNAATLAESNSSKPARLN